MSRSEVARRFTLDVLRGMEQAGALSLTHLDLSGRLDLDIAAFEAIARFLGALHDLSRWAIGDLLLQAEARFGEAAYQIAEATGRSERTLANWVWCASRIPPSRRREELSFSTHAAVAALEPAEQRELLDRAVAEGWSSREMRQAVRERREIGTGENEGCGDLLETMALELRARLGACGVPDVNVTVVVTGAGFMDEVRIP